MSKKQKGSHQSRSVVLRHSVASKCDSLRTAKQVFHLDTTLNHRFISIWNTSLEPFTMARIIVSIFVASGGVATLPIGKEQLQFSTTLQDQEPCDGPCLTYIKIKLRKLTGRNKNPPASQGVSARDCFDLARGCTRKQKKE